MSSSTRVTPERKRSKLRTLFNSASPIVFAGGHDGLGARLVEAAGFDGLWASGFELSASHAVPDASIVTMTEMLAAARWMNEAVDLPILADCDTGYGNAINAIRTVEVFETAGLAGICIEDSTFPKRCSFYSGVRRELADIDECRLKIRAAVEAKTTPDFFVLARTEAFVAGWDLDEALRRGRAYADAGADAILVHSKHSTVEQVAQFAERWDRQTPLVCVPTTYGTASVEELARLGFKLIIFANQALRASVLAMERTLHKLHATGTVALVDDEIAPLSDIYRLVDLRRLKSDEHAYLPSAPPDDPGMSALVLTAGAGEEELLERQMETLRRAGVRRVTALVGEADLGEVLLERAEAAGSAIVLYDDIVFDRDVIDRLVKSDDDITLVCDRSWSARTGRDASGLELVVEKPDSRLQHRFLSDAHEVLVVACGDAADRSAATAESIGLVKLTARGCRVLVDVEQSIDREASAVASGSCRRAFRDLIREVIRRGYRVRSLGIYQGWAEIGSFDEQSEVVS